MTMLLPKLPETSSTFLRCMCNQIGPQNQEGMGLAELAS